MSRERKLSHEERVLWGKVAESTKPLPGRMASLMEATARPGEPARTVGKDMGAAVTAAAQPVTPPSSPPGRRPNPHLHPIEKPVRRKIAKGRLALEARIDLHGLLQSEAHDLLQAFLFRAHSRGLRHVLVITGKGSSSGSDGALKRAVPQWLAKPDFRWLVSGYEQAARGHGGEGALYVRLKRPRGEAG